MTITLVKLAFAGLRSRLLASALTVLLCSAAAATIVLALEVGATARDPWQRTFEAANGAHVLRERAVGSRRTHDREPPRRRRTRRSGAEYEHRPGRPTRPAAGRRTIGPGTGRQTGADRGLGPTSQRNRPRAKLCRRTRPLRRYDAAPRHPRRLDRTARRRHRGLPRPTPLPAPESRAGLGRSPPPSSGSSRTAAAGAGPRRSG